MHEKVQVTRDGMFAVIDEQGNRIKGTKTEIEDLLDYQENQERLARKGPGFLNRFFSRLGLYIPYNPLRWRPNK
jgi:hypothetical protein